VATSEEVEAPAGGDGVHAALLLLLDQGVESSHLGRMRRRPRSIRGSGAPDSIGRRRLLSRPSKSSKRCC
jgi:hypothetical protein